MRRVIKKVANKGIMRTKRTNSLKNTTDPRKEKVKMKSVVSRSKFKTKKKTTIKSIVASNIPNHQDKRTPELRYYNSNKRVNGSRNHSS